MGTFYSGQSGQLYINGVKAAKVRSWGFTSSLSTLDTTTLEDTDRTAIAGIRNTTGTASLFYYQDGSTNSASTLINSLIKQSSGSTGQAAEANQVSLKLMAAEGKYVEGNVWLTSASMQMAVGTILSAEVTFEFDGAPTGLSL